MKKKLFSAVIASSLLFSSIPVALPAAQAATSAEIVRGVNFRTGPSTDSSRIRLLSKGESVTILEQVNSYWYKVRDKNGRVGYVSTSSQYINTNSTAPSSTTGTIIKSVSFRTGPSTSNSRIRYLQKNEKVTVLEQVNAYWYKVKDANGRSGYVSASNQYIRINGGSMPAPPPQPTNPSVPATVKAQKVIDAGMKYLGTPYEYGSSRSNTSTFDCSDFVRQAFLDGIGLKLPADSRQQGDYVKKIGKTSTNWRNLKPGDIMFFMSYKGSGKSKYTNINKQAQRITHDAIYLGNGKILHTYSKESGGVRVDTIEGKHWEYRFIFGGSAF